MRTTTNRAISLLGNVATLNERIIAFVNECYCREEYCHIKNIGGLVIEKIDGILLQADVDIKLNCGDVSAFLREAFCEASKNGDSKTAKEAEDLCWHLLKLDLEIRDKKLGDRK